MFRWREIAFVAALAVVLATAPAFGDEYYGPKVLKTENNKKVLSLENFGATAGKAAWVEISNGVQGGDRARSVNVFFNGIKICKRKNVNRNVGSYRVPVLLRAGNTIKVIVRGKLAAASVRVVSRGADFQRIVGFGDSLLAGFIDGSLVESYQVWGFGKQIADKIGAQFVLPLVGEPGRPPRIQIIDNIPIIPDGSTMGNRTNPGAVLNNFAVPGATIWSSLYVKTIGGKYRPFELILGGNKTMIESVLDRKPTFVILWIGSNDVLGMVSSTDPSDHTALNDFKRDFEIAVQQIYSTGASVIAANLPDITTVALLHEPLTIQKIWGVPAEALLLITDVLTVDLSLDPDEYLMPDEIAQIRETVQQFNAEIERICEKYGIPVVDAYAFSQQWHNSGVAVAGQRLTTEWRKGIYGLDGLHPSIAGHALIANQFIRKINFAYGTAIADVDVAAVLAQDPNRPSGVSAPSSVREKKSKGDFLRQALRFLNWTRRVDKREHGR